MRTQLKTTKIQASVFVELKDVLHGYNLESVADCAGVHLTTLYHWLEGRTHAPRISTLVKVADAVGYRIELRIVGKSTARRNHLRLV